MRSLFLLRILASRLRATHASFALRIVTSRSDFAKLDTTTNEKDLGVRVDSNLTFEHHVEDVVNKANIMLGMTRAYIFLDGPTLINLHTSLIRPLLEYSNVALTPVLIRDQLLLENVQRRATKLVPSLKNYSYEDRLRILNLPSLYYKRETWTYLPGQYQVNKMPLHLLETFESWTEDVDK